jgi:hypothetical protein
MMRFTGKREKVEHRSQKVEHRSQKVDREQLARGRALVAENLGGDLERRRRSDVTRLPSLKRGGGDLERLRRSRWRDGSGGDLERERERCGATTKGGVGMR